MPCQWNAIYTLGARRTDVLLQWVRLVATQQTTRGCDRVRCNLRPTGYVRILRAVHGTPARAVGKRLTLYASFQRCVTH